MTRDSRLVSGRRLALVGWILGGLFTWGGLIAPALAQQPTFTPTGYLNPSERERLFDQLRAEVGEFQRHYNLVKKLARLLGPSVVHLDANSSETVRGIGRRAVQEAGSGVVIEHARGLYVVTNRHVIKDSNLAGITIKFEDGSGAHPVKLWSDKETDIAVLALSGANHVPARIGNSDEVEIGDFVVAIGSPFGLSHSVTYGIISAKGRRDLELGDGGVKFQDFMQTDAAINPGNSGGPLFNLQGEVIGINTAIASNSGGSEGIGFSIPINMVMRVARQLIDRGAVQRGKLGVKLDSNFSYEKALNAGLPRLGGARVIEVFEGSAAKLAGVRDGDVIVRFDGSDVANDTHLVNLIALAEVGVPVQIEVFRDRKLLTFTTKLLAP